MVEREAAKEKESEILPVSNDISKSINRARETRERALKGRKLIKGSQIPFTLSQQGIIRRYAAWWIEDLPNPNWQLFIHEIRTHSGKHVHQGG